MALIQEMELSNWLNVNLYWKIIFYDFRAGIITLWWFASEEIEKQGKPPIEIFKYSHATEEYRDEKISKEIEVEIDDASNPDELIIDTFEKEVEIDWETVMKKMKRIVVYTGETKRVKNDDYIWKTWYLLIKLYRYLKTKDIFLEAQDA